MRIDAWEILIVDKEELADYQNKQSQEPVKIPVDDEWKTVSVNIWKMIGIHLHKQNHYYLHSRANVDEDHTILRSTCRKHVLGKKPSIPPNSLASGVDFGDDSKMEHCLECPNEMECAMTAMYLHCYCICKIQSTNTRDPSHQHSTIKAHSILFNHDAPESIQSSSYFKNCILYLMMVVQWTN